MIYTMRTLAIVENLTVDTTTTYYSKTIDIRQSLYFGVWVKATSVSGTPKMQIQAEQSYQKPVDSNGVLTEQAADSVYWAVPDGLSDIVAALNDQNPHIYGVSPKVMPYLRFKIIGLSTNPADTVLNMRFASQEPGGR